MVAFRFLSLFVAVIGMASALAKFHFSNVFGSHMVLQHSQPVPLWGWSFSGTTVSTSFQGKYYSVKADRSGFWKLILDPVSASLKPYEIKIKNNLFETIVLKDVLFGDVFLCSGQSNMQYSVNEVVNSATEIQNSNNYPFIRLTSGPNAGAFSLDNITHAPYDELHVTDLAWSVASNTTVTNYNGWDYFSAVCWFTVRDLFDQLNGTVPIGAIAQTWGGTSIQWWSSPEALETCKDVYATGSACCDFGGFDSCLYCSQIAPYTLGPMQFKQVLWYQGEQNAGQNDYYKCALPALINDLRVKFAQPDLAFGVCLLAAWEAAGQETDPAFPLLRMTQVNTSIFTPGVFTVSTLDQGDPLTGDIHSPYKQAVGQRAAKGSAAIAYGDSSSAYLGPRALSFTSTVQNHYWPSHTVTVSFDTFDRNQLSLNQTVSCPPDINPLSCESFAVLTTNCIWYSYENKDDIFKLYVKDSTLIMTINIESATEPLIAVRGYYANWPIVKLTNSEGLPAEPFLLVTKAEHYCHSSLGLKDNNMTIMKVNDAYKVNK